MDKVFAYVRQKLGRPKEDKMDRVDTNAMICGIFMTASMTAAVHFGKYYEEFLCFEEHRILRDSAFCSITQEIDP